MQKLNTHYYDGKLREKFKELKSKLNQPIEQTPSIDQQPQLVDLKTCFKEIRNLIFKQLTGKEIGRALYVWNQLQNDLGKPANFDSTSQISVDELLPLVWSIVRKWDLSAKMLFLEQWNDILRGRCPQGRVTRLIQMV